MSKPLELVIHPPLEPVVKNYALSCLAMGEQPKMHDPGEFGFGTSKRFTDAELAAEYYQSYAEYLAFSHRDPREWAIGDTLHRFATHPHYDEDAA